MFDVGFWEVALIALIALLVFGPERLPRVAREAALWIRKARHAVTSVRDEINHELELQDLKQSLQDKKRQIRASLEESIEILPADTEKRSKPADDANDGQAH